MDEALEVAVTVIGDPTPPMPVRGTVCGPAFSRMAAGLVIASIVAVVFATVNVNTWVALFVVPSDIVTPMLLVPNLVASTVKVSVPIGLMAGPAVKKPAAKPFVKVNEATSLVSLAGPVDIPVRKATLVWAPAA